MPYSPTSSILNQTPWLGDIPTTDDYLKPLPAPKRAEENANPFNASQRTSKAYDDMRKLDTERPTKPKPGLWRTLASIGTGFGIGYANAGGRIRPVDPIPAMRAIGLGDYDSRVSDWQDRVKQAQDTFNSARLADSSDLSAREAQLAERDAPVRNRYMNAQAALMEKQVAAKDSPEQDQLIGQPHYVERSDGLYQISTYKSGKTVRTKLDVPPEEAKKAIQGSPFTAVRADGKKILMVTLIDGTFKEIPNVTAPDDGPRTGLTPAEAAVAERARTENALQIDERQRTELEKLRKEFDASLTDEQEVFDELTRAWVKKKVKRDPTPEEVQMLEVRSQGIVGDMNAARRRAGVPVAPSSNPPAVVPGLPSPRGVDPDPMGIRKVR